MMFILVALSNYPESEPIELASTTKGKVTSCIININISHNEARGIVSDFGAGDDGTLKGLQDEYIQIDSVLFSHDISSTWLVNIQTSEIDATIVGHNAKGIKSKNRSKCDQTRTAQKLSEILNTNLTEGSLLFSDSVKPNIHVLVNGIELRQNCKKSFIYPQDTFQRFIGSDGSSITRYIYQPSLKKNCLEQLQTAYFKEPIAESPVSVEGGNIHVIDDFAFIGYNSLMDGYYVHDYSNNKGADSEARLGKIKCSDCKNDSLKITNSVSNILGKQIVWVGTAEREPVGAPDAEYENSDKDSCMAWQPFYHLDLFFQPVSFDKSSSHLKYFIATVDSIWQNPMFYNDSYSNGKFKKRIKKIQASLDSTKNHISKQCKRIGVTPIPIDVPVYITPDQFDSEGRVLSIYSCLNGIMEDKKFFFPHYNAKRHQEDEWYQKILPICEGIMENEVNPIRVPSDKYWHQSALHCMVYVVDRTK